MKCAERTLAQIDERLRVAASLISQALMEVESIRDAKPLGLTPTYYNDLHRPRDKRPFTLKDAKPRATVAARYLRQAWDILDPSIGTDMDERLAQARKETGA